MHQLHKAGTATMVLVRFFFAPYSAGTQDLAMYNRRHETILRPATQHACVCLY